MDKVVTKAQLSQLIEANYEQVEAIAGYLAAHPELSGQEVLASTYLRQVLREAGFVVEELVPAEYPTAFHAWAGRGPVQIGLLAEYDALLGMGHGCGHNLIAAMSLGAALALAQVVAEAATIHVYGCPAEETKGSKVYLAEQHVFDHLTAALMVHPSSDTAVGGTSYASHPVQFTFRGEAAHVADVLHGINALDALAAFYCRLRELDTSFTEPHIIGAIITEGGTAPNIVPARAVMKATIRALRSEYLEEVMLPRIRLLAEEIAAAYGCGLAMEHYEPLYMNLLNDARMNKYFENNLTALGEKVIVNPADFAAGSTDVGNVSHVTRTCQARIKIGDGIAAHTLGFARAAASTYGRQQAVQGAKALACTVVDILAEAGGI